MSDPLIRIVGLKKTFTLHAVDGRTISGLRDINLDVPAHRHVALAGTSGAGKSTLLKCIHRTYTSDCGSIWYRSSSGTEVDLASVDDASIADLRAREIGYVSQFLRAEPRRGVLNVVERAALRSGVHADEAQDRAADVLRRMNIEEKLWSTYPTLLSGGEKQRVNLAAGIVVAPRLLLLDEPVSALDPVTREAVLAVIAELTDQGATVLSVFHDLDAMRRLADQIVVLSDGQIVDEGTPTEVLSRGLELQPV